MEHFLNLDMLFEFEWSKEDQEQFLKKFHQQLEKRKHCHIFRKKYFCFCVNGQKPKEVEDA